MPFRIVADRFIFLLIDKKAWKRKKSPLVHRHANYYNGFTQIHWLIVNFYKYNNNNTQELS